MLTRSEMKSTPALIKKTVEDLISKLAEKRNSLGVPREKSYNALKEAVEGGVS